MSIGINLNNWKVRDFWSAVGAGIAGVTGLVTGGNYIRRAPIRARAEKMDARRVQQELQGYHTKGTYNDADLARAYAEQGINPIC